MIDIESSHDELRSNNAAYADLCEKIEELYDCGEENTLQCLVLLGIRDSLVEEYHAMRIRSN